MSAQGKETGRDAVSDQQLIASLGEKYEPLAQQVYTYNKTLKDYVVNAGLISKELSNQLDVKYPNYVPLKRLFSEVEQEAMKFEGKGAPASVSSQSVIQRLEGSEREILSPLENILENTAVAFRQGERNKAGGMLANYVRGGVLPGKELKSNETTVGKHTVSFLDNGVKRAFEVSLDIATAAKNLNEDELSR